MDTTAPEYSSPAWLDEKFLQELIRRHDGNDKISVRNMKVKNSVSKGRNFLSQMFSVEVAYSLNGETKRKYLIIKTFPVGKLFQQVVLEMNMFERELSVYNELIPHIQTHYEAVTGKKANSIGPENFDAKRDDAVIMEDLTTQGYKLPDRFVGLDLKETRAVLKALGRFHALTRMIVDSESHLNETFSDHIFNKERTDEWIRTNIQGVAERIRQWEEYERFADKLESIAATAAIRISEQTKPENSVLPVIIHGDCLVNNIMLHYDSDQRVDDVRFIDFQMCRVTSPALDLLFLLYTSVENEVRKECWVDLLRGYLKSLNETLIDIQREKDVLSEEQLLEEIAKQQLFGLTMSTVFLPAVLGSPESLPDLSKMTEDETFTVSEMSSNYRFRKVYQDLLLHFETVGVI